MTNTTYTPTIGDVIALYYSRRPGCRTEATDLARQIGASDELAAHLATEAILDAVDNYLMVADELTTFGIPDPEPITLADLVHGPSGLDPRYTGPARALAEQHGLVWPPRCIDTALADVARLRRLGRLPKGGRR